MTDDYGPPPADDREEEHPDSEEAIPAYSVLIALWAERDANYAKAPIGLKPEGIAAVMAYRAKEANALPVADRARAFLRVATWYPPEHGQGRL